MYKGLSYPTTDGQPRKQNFKKDNKDNKLPEIMSVLKTPTLVNECQYSTSWKYEKTFDKRILISFTVSANL